MGKTQQMKKVEGKISRKENMEQTKCKSGI